MENEWSLHTGYFQGKLGLFNKQRCQHRTLHNEKTRLFLKNHQLNGTVLLALCVDKIK